MIVEYHRPESLSEALEFLARQEPMTVPLGGGTVLSQQRSPDFAVVDLQKLGLDRLEKEGQLLLVGARVTLQQLLEYQEWPDGIGESMRQSLLLETASNLRQMASAAGTLVSCDGRSPFVTALLALDPRLVWAPRMEQQSLGDYLPLREPFGQGRLLVSLRIPLNTRLRFASVSRTPVDRPVVCAAVATWPSGRTRVTLGGHGSAPVLAMDGPEPGGAVVAAREGYRFAGDEWASAPYRMDVAGKLVQRLLAEPAGGG
jgi:CO/xanthine dehydrogenase FAD-binding subunit